MSVMVTESGIGISVLPYHDQVLMVLTNPHGGQVPVPLSIEEAAQLSLGLFTDAVQALVAFDIEPGPWLAKLVHEMGGDL